jgi:hypothetical protein
MKAAEASRSEKTSRDDAVMMMITLQNNMMSREDGDGTSVSADEPKNREKVDQVASNYSQHLANTTSSQESSAAKPSPQSSPMGGGNDKMQNRSAQNNPQDRNKESSSLSDYFNKDTRERSVSPKMISIAHGIPAELRLRYRKQRSGSLDEKDALADDTNDDNHSTDSMPSLVSYLGSSFRSQSSSIGSNVRGSSVASSAGIDFADDCSSIPSVNTIKTFATTESEVATVKHKNYIEGIVTPKKERRWDESGAIRRKSPLGHDSVIVLPTTSLTPQISDFSAIVETGQEETMPPPSTISSND